MDASPPRRRGRRLLIALGVVVVGLLLSLWLTVRWYVSPSVPNVDSADAIVALFGGRGERQERALELAASGVADTVVFSSGEGYLRRELEELCRTDPGEIEYICVQPEVHNTKGEAQAISAVAHANGWAHIVVVTSDYHNHRAGIRFRQCFDGQVTMSPANGGTTQEKIVHEMLGTVEAWVLDRGC